MDPTRRTTQAQLLASIRGVIAGYPDAPADLLTYEWFSVPRYWESVTVPRSGRIEPRHEDRHSGIAFKVGWSERDRVAALWIL